MYCIQNECVFPWLNVADIVELRARTERYVSMATFNCIYL